jgi:hypothetical protein
MKDKNVPIIRSRRLVKAAANMSEVKVAHVPKFSLTNVTDQQLKEIERLAERLRMRSQINKYVHGKK